MVALKKNGKWSLFIYDEGDDEARLIPVDFAQNVSSLEVYEYNNLVVTSDAVYSLKGEKLLEHHGGTNVIKLSNKVILTANGGVYGKQILVWDNEKVLLQESCSNFRYNNKYLALCYRNIWSLFKINGSPIDEGAFQADDVEIHNDLLVAKSLGKQDLYSLKKGTFLKKDQTKIVCSDSCGLALCARIGDTSLNVFCYGKWHQIPDVGDFGIVAGMDYMFYVKRGDKYFLYEDMHRFMRQEYPDGVDFVAYQNGLLMIINNGEPCFYSQRV